MHIRFLQLFFLAALFAAVGCESTSRDTKKSKPSAARKKNATEKVDSDFVLRGGFR